MKARNIKPGFFKNEDIADCSFAARLLFIGLWCMADRNGIIEYRPRKIKAEIFPYDTRIDTENLLNELSEFVHILSFSDKPQYIQIIKFNRNQSPHRNEKALDIKDMDKLQVISGTNEKLQPPLLNDVCSLLNDERGLMNDKSARKSCFESVWKKYPNKTGKSRAEKRFFATVKTDGDFKSIDKAIDNYLSMLALPANNWRKPQDGSTWFNSWHDWTEWEPSEEELKGQQSRRESTNISAARNFADG